MVYINMLLIQVLNIIFRLFPWPTEKKKPDVRMRWRKAINRAVPGKKTHHLWDPSPSSRVCSRHFVDGEPTSNHADPELHLGYELRKRNPVRPYKERCELATVCSTQEDMDIDSTDSTSDLPLPSKRRNPE